MEPPDLAKFNQIPKSTGRQIGRTGNLEIPEPQNSINQIKWEARSEDPHSRRAKRAGKKIAPFLPKPL